jgi:diphthamide biosynthesis methyltransferase
VIGLGLGDAKDITVKGLEILKRCELIYLESYTSILTCGKEEMVNKTKCSQKNNSLILKINFRRNFMKRR